MTDYHAEDEARWVARMRERHARGQEYVCGLADVLRVLAERDEARAEVERLRDERLQLQLTLDARWSLRRELEELLGVPSRAASEEQLRLGVEAVRRLMRERDEARAEVEWLREEIGKAWFVDGCDLATALRRKTSMLQRLADGGAE